MAQAVFVNGGFEADAIDAGPSGWLVEKYLNPTGLLAVPPSSFAQLNLTPDAGGRNSWVVGSTATETIADPQLGTGASFRYPRFGLRSGVVNPGNTNVTGVPTDAQPTGRDLSANSIRQTMTLAEADKDPLDGEIHIRFVAAPVLENPSHDPEEQPYFFIQLRNVTRNTVLYTNFNFAGQTGVAWKSVGTTQYTDWQLVDIAPGTAAVVGEQVELLVLAAGCSLGGHYGRVYLDAFGSVIPGLYVTGTAPTSSPDNANLTYTLTYRNGGATTASGTSISFNTPPGTTYVSTTGSGCTTPTVGTAGSVVCPIGSLAAGASGAITVTVRVPSGLTGLLTAQNYSIQATGISPLLGSKIDTIIYSGALTLTALSGTPQSAVVGTTYASNLVVRVRDGANNPVPGIRVDFTVPASGASATLPIAFGTTDASGLVSVQPSANSTAGSFSVVASAAAAPSTASFSLTNTPGAPASITAISGGSQSTVVNTAFAQPLVVEVRDASNNVVPGATVTFTPPASGASAAITGTLVTNAQGRVSATATANTVAGGPYSVTAAVGAVTGASFSLTNTPGAPASITAISGGSQSTVVNTAFAQPLVAEVRDAYGNVVPNATLTASTPSPGASAIVTGSLVTDPQGRVSLTATANTSAGGYTVTLSTGAATTASYSLTNLVGAPASLALESGGGQQALVTTVYAQPVVFVVKDAFGLAVRDVQVDFAVPSVGPSAAPSAPSLRTDASGRVSLTVTANTRAGAFDVEARVAALAPATAILTNTPGEAVAVRVVSGGSQTTQTGTAFAAPLVVEAVDSYGNPVPGATITWSVPGTGASATLSATQLVTGADGRATLTATANDTAGSYPATARLPGGQQADFVLTNTGAEAVSLTVASGSPQSTTVGTAFAAPLVALVRRGTTPVANAAVTFIVPAQGASATLSAVTAQTDAQGLAQVTATASTRAGAYVVTASTPGSAQPATFSLTNQPGAPAALVPAPGSSPQSAQTGTDFSEPLVAQVIDTYGNPVPNAQVAFTAPGTGATASLGATTTLTSDANGFVSLTATAGSTTGTYEVTATTPGAPSVAFTLTNTSAAPLALEVVSGSPQRATVATAFTAPLRVRVTRSGVPVSGEVVSWAAPATGARASFSSATATTDGAGLAEVTATAGQVAGLFEAQATVSGGAAPARFLLTNVAGAPAGLSALAASTPQSARVLTAYALPLLVKVVDAFGNAVPGAVVTFAAPMSEPTARLTASPPATDVDGQASVTAIASATAGAFEVTAAVSGVSMPARFQLTNLAGDPASLAIASGAGQSTLATTAFPEPLVVSVKDALGNPVTQASVTLTLPTSGPGASAAPATLVTDANGRASTQLTANDVPGGFDVTLSVPGASAPLTSRFTVLAIPTTTTLAASPQPATVDRPVTLTAEVTSDHGTPTGEVRFLVDGKVVGTATLAGGRAELAPVALGAGPYQLQAVYDAQGAFGASQSDVADLEVGSDSGTLNGGGGCSCRSADGTGGLAALLGLVALVVRARRRSSPFGARRRSASPSGPLAVALAIVAAGAALRPLTAHAQAQAATGASLNTFHASPAGSEWFGADSLDLRGHWRPAARLLFDLAHNPLVVYEQDGRVREVAVSSQVWLSLGGSIVAWDRVRLALNLPVALHSASSSTATYNGVALAPQSSWGLGDIGLALDVRLFGDNGGPFVLAVGAGTALPTGAAASYFGDGRVGLTPRLAAAGQVQRFVWAANIGYALRGGAIAGVAFRDELRYGASAGFRFFEGRLLVGPELHGLVEVAGLKPGRPPALEVDLGAHYQLNPDWRVSLGGGAGLLRSPGVPDFRVLAAVHWAPRVVPPPPDTDGDGVLDGEDRCPREPSSARPDLERPGCPFVDRDADGDGVLDADDACPAVAQGPTPDARRRGCPEPDTDGDGLLDSQDACPAEVPGQHPDPKRAGCPDADTDADGVFDAADQCVSTPAGLNPDAARPGCPAPDRDADLVPDASDACPDEKGAPSPDLKSNGCPGLVSLEGSRILILTPVNFATNSDVILESSNPVLRAVADTLKAYPQIERLSIEGHTDSQGSAVSNKDLSERRARSVMRWLVQAGIDATRLEAHGFGLERPIADNRTVEGRAKNRRVDFRILPRAEDASPGKP